MQSYHSVVRGDGGLTPGQLVFQEEFEKFAGCDFNAALDKLTNNREPDKKNIGGPSIVSLIHAAQVLDKNRFEVRFYGRGGMDDAGEYLLSALQQTPVVLQDYQLIPKPTPATFVLSDPNYDNGHGERMFINSIGAAWDFNPVDLQDDFFKSQVVVFGGTALVPGIHDHLTSLLKKAKSTGCITVVNTVFDFRSEKLNPGARWPLGESDKSYQFIDLLIADQEEALRLSGKNNPDEAMLFFQEQQVSSVIITNGSKNILFYSDGHFFEKVNLSYLPVSQRVSEELKDYKEGDTTGCGDNFVGGVIASLVSQIDENNEKPDLREACYRGIVAGGFACFYMGGTYFEREPGEKKERLESYYESYKKQVAFKISE